MLGKLPGMQQRLLAAGQHTSWSLLIILKALAAQALQLARATLACATRRAWPQHPPLPALPSPLSCAVPAALWVPARRAHAQRHALPHHSPHSVPSASASCSDLLCSLTLAASCAGSDAGTLRARMHAQALL